MRSPDPFAGSWRSTPLNGWPAVIPPEDLAELAERKKRLAQCLLLCGSSPFLVNLIFKTPDTLRWLFLENGIDLARSAEDMLADCAGHGG